MAFFLMFSALVSVGQEKIRVMTFNLWHGGDGIKWPKDTTVKYQLEAIRKSKADIVGFEEQTSNHSDNQSRAKLLADSLGWHYFIIDGSRAIIARYAMQAIDNKEQKAQAALVNLDQDRQLVFGVMHLMYTPYEPYDIADGKLKTKEEAEASARKSRLHQVQSMTDDIAAYLQNGLPIVLVGDFNEPSCLDWTAKAIKQRNNSELGFMVDWPASRYLIERGFRDAYRTFYPNVKRKPGYTWTSVEGLWRDPEIHDRIDLVFVSKGIKVTNAQVIGEESALSDMVIPKWPSDHRAVVVELLLK